MDQRTDEWFAARLGKVTASRIADVMAKTRSGYGASRKNYMGELLVERLTGRPTEGYLNEAMQRGIDLEPVAIVAYEFKTDASVESIGFVEHNTILMAGASPDGLVGDDGLIEVKCPNTMTHIEFIRSGKPDDKYIKQMQWQMACTDRNWCDFVSYDDRLPEPLQFRFLRIPRDQALIENIYHEVLKFLDELDALQAEMLEEMKRHAA